MARFAARAQEGMQGPDNEEEDREREHDGRARGKIDGPRQIDAEEAADGTDDGREEHHRGEVGRQQARRGGWGNQQGEDQDIADRAYGNDHRGGHTQVEDDIQGKDRQAHGAGGLPVQAGGIELRAKGHDHG